MILVKHRINHAVDLRKVPPEYGIELDIRTKGEHLIVHHDPFLDGENFEDWIREYKHKFLILNVKEEGLETRLLQLMKTHNIEDFFFLDQSLPFMVKTARAGEKRCAVRVSEYESIETALNLQGMVQWLWLDCFNSFPLVPEDFKMLNDLFSICIVSPELQGHFADQEIKHFKDIFSQAGTQPAAVCTKFPEKWL